MKTIISFLIILLCSINVNAQQLIEDCRNTGDDPKLKFKIKTKVIRNIKILRQCKRNFRCVADSLTEGNTKTIYHFVDNTAKTLRANWATIGIDKTIAIGPLNDLTRFISRELAEGTEYYNLFGDEYEISLDKDIHAWTQNHGQCLYNKVCLKTHSRKECRENYYMFEPTLYPYDKERTWFQPFRILDLSMFSYI